MEQLNKRPATKCDAIAALMAAREYRSVWGWCARAVEELHTERHKSYDQIIEDLREGRYALGFRSSDRFAPIEQLKLTKNNE